MTAKELRALSAADLNKKLADLKAELFALRFQHATNQLDNPIRIADLRRSRPSSVKTKSKAERRRQNYGKRFEKNQNRSRCFRQDG